MSNLIKREDVIKAIDDKINGSDNRLWLREIISELPSAQPERKKGKWTEKHHAYSDEESVIEEWQSCRCSECGRYDTRPYMYYFSEPNYCSYCGADMRGEQE